VKEFLYWEVIQAINVLLFRASICRILIMKLPKTGWPRDRTCHAKKDLVFFIINANFHCIIVYLRGQDIEVKLLPKIERVRGRSNFSGIWFGAPCSVQKHLVLFSNRSWIVFRKRRYTTHWKINNHLNKFTTLITYMLAKIFKKPDWSIL